MNWWKPLKGRVKRGESLKKHTTFGVGGKAAFFITPKDENDLKLLLNLLKRGKMPYSLIGAGSNLLVADKGVRAVVISLDSPFFRKISRKCERFEAGSAVRLGELISTSGRMGLSGFEPLAGIPGSLGGALIMNAGIPGRSISDNLASVRVMDKKGRVRKLDKKDISFRYRGSSLEKYIVLSASFKLRRSSKSKVLDGVKRYLSQRRLSQDWGARSAGCVFKNPAAGSAGRLIDLCGLKGKKVGGAVVSSRHANFILNKGKATSSDIFKLMRLIEKKVNDRFGIELEPEIKIWRN